MDQIEKRKERMESLKEAAKPLMDWMRDNCHPNHTCIVNCTNVELLESIMYYLDINNIKD